MALKVVELDRETTPWLEAESEWLDREQGADLWMSELWLGTWWQEFGEGRELRLLEGEAGGVCPLYWQPGWRKRRLAFLGPEYRRHEMPVEWDCSRLAEWLGGQRDWDEMELESVPMEQAAAWIAGFRRAGLRAEVGERRPQRYVWLRRPWAEVEAECHAGMLKDIARRERGLRREATVEMRLVTDPAGLEEVFERCVAIEASGWKGEIGTALACDGRVQRFYRQLMREAAARGQLHLPLLYVNGSVIAFQFNLIQGRVVGGAKLGHLEEWRRFAPGLILQGWALRQLHAAGYWELDLSGGAEPYKANWTKHARELVNLRVYSRTARGRAAEAVAGARAWVATEGKRWQRAAAPRN